jgi:hypothetical protein
MKMMLENIDTQNDPLIKVEAKVGEDMFQKLEIETA